ncbi:hypothetical protein KCP69_11365 [Salmonella enterica subsp. enterica]|nr:hypothetical protein KCP69_11365 [Salmonella enterica subsp. enterica]
MTAACFSTAARACSASADAGYRRRFIPRCTILTRWRFLGKVSAFVLIVVSNNGGADLPCCRRRKANVSAFVDAQNVHLRPCGRHV